MTKLDDVDWWKAQSALIERLRDRDAKAKAKAKLEEDDYMTYGPGDLLAREAAAALTALQDRVRVLEDALRPLAACVYNDNGELTNDAFWDACLTAASSPLSETVAEQLYEALKHGDDIHRAWLREAITAFFAGQPIPPPRASPTPKA